MNKDYFSPHLTEVAKPTQTIQQKSDKGTSEIINFGNFDVRNKLAMMSAVKNLNPERANGMEWFDHYGVDSISHSSLDLDVQSYFGGEWNSLPNNQFEGGKWKKTRKSTDEGFLRYFDDPSERHSDVYGWHPKASRTSPKNKHTQYISRKATHPMLQPETADISFTNNIFLSREPREGDWFWGSTLCSNSQAANVSNPSFDKTRRYRNLSDLEQQRQSTSRPWDLNQFPPICPNSEAGSTSAYRSMRMLMGSRDQVLPLSQLSLEELMLRNEGIWQFQELYHQFQKNYEYEFEKNSVDEKTRKHQSLFSTINSGESPSRSVQKSEYLKRRELTPRPSPKNPKRYKAIDTLLVRAGRSLKSPIVTYLKEGCIVTVNQLKKRRARIVKPNKEGQYERVGWVSTHLGDNRMLVPWNNGSPSVE